MKNKKQQNFHIVYGKHASFAVLQNTRRVVYKIFLQEGIKFDKNITSLFKVRPEILTKMQMAKICRDGDKHQGIIVYVGDLINNLTLKQHLEINSDKPKFSIAIMDQLNDPHNVGAILRSAYCFGIDLILVTKYNMPTINSSVIRSSAGMSEFLDIITITNINEAVNLLKNEGFHTVALDQNNESRKLSEIFSTKTKNAFIIGNEGKGVRQSITENVDEIASIMMKNDAESLNVSNAAAIAMYELSLL